MKIELKIAIYLSIVLLIFVAESNAQISRNGFYANDTLQDIICIKNDTVFLRLSNNDAFGTYSLFLGSYKLYKKKIKTLVNKTSFETFSLSQKSGKEGEIQFELYYFDKRPMKHTNLTLSGSKKGNKVFKFSDKQGIVNFKRDELDIFPDSLVKVSVFNSGFRMEMLINLKLGNFYTITSNIPKERRLVISDAKILFFFDDNLGINEIRIGKRKDKINLKRVGDCKSCRDLIFEEE